jgi:hypothetical protein
VVGVVGVWRRVCVWVRWRSQGWTPLHVAASRAHVDLVGVLCAAGADPSIVDSMVRCRLRLWPSLAHVHAPFALWVVAASSGMWLRHP